MKFVIYTLVIFLLVSQGIDLYRAKKRVEESRERIENLEKRIRTETPGGIEPENVTLTPIHLTK